MNRKYGAFFEATLVAGYLFAAGPRSASASPAAPAGCPAFPAPVVAYLKGLAIDPHVLHEKRRRARRDMIEESPYDVCLHREWLALQAGVAPTTASATATEGETDAALAPMSATVGTNIAPPTVLPPIGSGGVPGYQGETAISVNPDDPLRIVGHANTFYQDPAAACQAPAPNAGKTFGTMALFGSNDGGVSWHYNCAPWPSDATGSISGAAAFFGSDPALDWDSSGNAYAVYLLIDQNSTGTADGSAIAIAKSTDSGLSWSPLGVIVDNLSNSSLFEDKEFVAIDRSGGAHDGRIYVIWDENNAERIAYSDTGATGSWTTVVLDTNICIGADVKVGADGTVYAVWNRLGFRGNAQSSETTVFAKSVNGGATWSSAATVATHRLFSFGSNNTPPAQNQRGVNAFPSLDVDRNAASAFLGRLYVTYADFPVGTTSGNNLDVYLKSSSNGGTTWTSDPGVLVNDDGGSSTQFFPWLAVDASDGTVNLSWYDTRNDSVNNRKTQFFYGRSSDGGASVEANVLLTDGGSNFVNHVSYCDENSTDNTSFNPNQYGDYSGISANDRQVHALWTDSRNLYPGHPDGRLEDVATTTLVNCSPPFWPGGSGYGVVCGPSGNTVTWSLPAWGTNATGGTFSVNRFTDGSCTAGKTVLASGLSAGTTEYLDTTASPGAVYTYSVTATNDCPGTALTPMSADSTCAPVSSNLVATVAADGSTILQAGCHPSVTLTASPSGGSYLWSPGGETTQSIVKAISGGSDSNLVTVTLDGCSARAPAPLTTVVTVIVLVNASGPTTFCEGGSVTLEAAAGAASYLWSPGGQTTQNITVTTSGSYSVQTTDSNGCIANSTPVLVTVTPKLTATASGSATICTGASATLSGSGGTSCSWSPSTGLDNASSCSPHSSPSSTTTYTLTVSGAGSCSSTNAPTVTVTVKAKPTAVASGSATICAGTSTALSGSGGTSCSWLPTTGLDNAASCAPNANPSSTTTYTLTVASNGCSSTNSPTATVTVRPLPTPTPSTLPGGAVSVPYSQTIGSSTGTAPFSFAVVLGTLPAGLGIGSSTGTIAGTPTTAQDASFTIRVTDANGCFKDKAYGIPVTNLAAQLESVEGRSPYPPSGAEPNGVLEPGETSVPFAPSWKNVGSTTASAVSGALANFSGPTNGTVSYAISKAAASYGALAAGAANSCGADCYTLGLTAATRPAAHWDATVTETLSSGQSHTWTLHVGKSFGDVAPTNGFYSYVETIFHAGITTGTSPGLFSPAGKTRRDQMATFIARAHLGSDAAIPVSGTVPGRGSYNCASGGNSLFSDVAVGTVFCRSIHWVAAQGLSFGCTDGTQFVSTFCPAGGITRGTMATFIARDLAGGDASVPGSAPDPGNGRSYNCTDGQPNAFPDVSDSSPICKHVYYIWSKNIVDGFTNGNYGPAGIVVRSQMAKFLVNAYTLTISGP
ncbi:MAG TPA: S-layer homology domain-containing protein [Thermoanaerobaculia bacterium]|nr:S-layer homology domain-containing protein [Thermoanaerobaculia bacterium]